MQISIFGQERDPQVALVRRQIEKLGVKARVFSLKYSNILIKGDKILLDGEDLLSYHAFYLRQVSYSLPKVFRDDVSKDEWDRYYPRFLSYLDNERERLSLRLSMVKILSNEKLVVNPYRSLWYQRLKPYQLYLLEKNNIPVPKWFCSNDLNQVKRNHVHKPLTSGEVVDLVDEEWIRKYKRKVTIFQEYVKGIPIRASVLDDKVIGSAEIISKGVDARIGFQKMTPTTLPEDVKEVLISGLKTLGMYFSGVDLMKEGDRYYILEYNPSPGFYFLEKKAGIPISENLARFLVENSKR